MRKLIRAVRIVSIAAAFFAVFQLSQAATAARNAGETAPGIGAAIGVLTFFFLVNAIITERTQGAELDQRKDLLWGLASGGIAILVRRLTG